MAFHDLAACPDKTILVPLTNSLYVPGKLCDTENVVVDVGTGYYVKKVSAVPACYANAMNWCTDRPVLDAGAGGEALRGQGGLHPHEPRGPARHDSQEAGQHELSHQYHADETTRTGSSEGIVRVESVKAVSASQIVYRVQLVVVMPMYHICNSDCRRFSLALLSVEEKNHIGMRASHTVQGYPRYMYAEKMRGSY